MVRSLALFIALMLVSCSLTTMRAGRFTPPPIPSGVRHRVPDVANGSPDVFGVIIGLNAENRQRNNISLAYQVLVEHGVKHSDVFILDVGSETPIFPKTDTTSLLAVQELLHRLADAVEEWDDIIVYVTGHGAFIENEPHLVLNPSQSMASSVFLASLDMIRPGRGLLILDQCFWGAARVPSSCEWTTITLAAEGSETKGDDFPRHLWYALRVSSDLEKAFLSATVADAASRSGENRPSMAVRTCGDANRETGVLKSW